MIKYFLACGKWFFRGTFFLFLYAFLCISESLNLIFLSLQMSDIVATKNLYNILIASSIYVHLLIHVASRLWHLHKPSEINIWLLIFFMCIQIILYGLLYSRMKLTEQYITFLVISNAFQFYEIFHRCVNKRQRSEWIHTSPPSTSSTVVPIIVHDKIDFKIELHECEENCEVCPCSICLENMSTLTKLQCGHCLHQDCAKKLLESNNMESSNETELKCPLCRSVTNFSSQSTNSRVVIIVENP